MVEKCCWVWKRRVESVVVLLVGVVCVSVFVRRSKLVKYEALERGPPEAESGTSAHGSQAAPRVAVIPANCASAACEPAFASAHGAPSGAHSPLTLLLIIVNSAGTAPFEPGARHGRHCQRPAAHLSAFPLPFLPTHGRFILHYGGEAV